MAVYVDNFRVPARVGRISSRWSHLYADTREELHEFADRLGLKRSWFQDPLTKTPTLDPDSRAAQTWHYDVTDSMRQRAIALGAVPVDFRDGHLSATIDRRMEPGR